MEPKRKKIATVDLRSNNNAVENSSNIAVDSYLPEEDSWIIVKKQKVNILIPRLPTIEQPTVPDLEQGQLCGDISNKMTNIPSELLLERSDGSMSLSPNSNTQSCTKVYSPADNAVATPEPRRPVEDQVGLTSFSGKTETVIKSLKTSPKLVRPSMMKQGLSVFYSLSTSTMNINKKMRASNLERNILSAGGLSRWLSSLGLEQFEGILRAKNVNKFHLADLSMKKLKDMGAHAVGPRRKLIHAIDCVCQPYSYAPYKNFHYRLR
ncbi:hypothetical protein SOVF_177020 [Spinacia oleracea]|uniref:SAM domain-containing protein n=1 Tax=Spinacia oleracea TaxID=3562 RepID=A0A9R0K5B5_SPIOL|nr:uncharacterized protein LOC110798186 [Spinacia oleracea]KNA06878.1 hypothetical protein SOVF_177020 [Spinacia oleracea]